MSLSAPSVRVVFYTSNDEQAKEHSVDVPSHCVTRAGWLEMCPPSARDVIEQAGADASSTDIIRSGQLDKVLSRDAHMHFVLHAMLCAFYDNAQLVDDTAKKLHREQHVEQFVGFFTAGTAATKISNQMYAYAELLGRRSTVPGILDFCPASHFKEAKSALMQSPQLRQVLLDRALDIALPLEEQIQQEAAALERATLALQTSDAESKQPNTHETSRKLRRPKQDKSHLLSSRATKEQHQQALKALRAKKLNATTIKAMSEDILHENPFVSQLRTIYHHDGELYYEYDRDDGSTKPAVGRTAKKQEAANDKRVGDRMSTSSISYTHLRRPERNHTKIDEFHEQLYRDHVTCLGQNGSQIVIVWKQHVSWVVSERVIDQLGWRQHCAWLRGASEPVVEAQLRVSRLRLSPRVHDDPSEDELQQRLREMEKQMADVRAQLERKRRAPATNKPNGKEQQPKRSKRETSLMANSSTTSVSHKSADERKSEVEGDGDGSGASGADGGVVDDDDGDDDAAQSEDEKEEQTEQEKMEEEVKEDEEMKEEDEQEEEENMDEQQDGQDEEEQDGKETGVGEEQAAATTNEELPNEDADVGQERDVVRSEDEDRAAGADPAASSAPATSSDQSDAPAYRSIVLPIDDQPCYEATLTDEALKSLMGGCTTNVQNFADMGSLGFMRIYYRSDSIAKGLPVNPHCGRWKYHRKVIPGLRGVCVLRVIGSDKHTVDISPEITADNWKQSVLVDRD